MTRVLSLLCLLWAATSAAEVNPSACAAGRTCRVAGLAITSSSSSCVVVDTNVLKVDCTNNRVGVNTTSPAVALDVTGAIKASSQIGTSLASGAAFYVGAGGTISLDGAAGSGGSIYSASASTLICFNVANAGKMCLSGSALTPYSASAISLGSGAVPWLNAAWSGTATASTASGSSAIEFATDGARLDLGTGSLDYLISLGSGTGIQVGDGSASAPPLVTSQFKSASGSFRGLQTTTTNNFQSDTTAATMTSSVAAIDIMSLVTPDANDLIAGFAYTGGFRPWRIDKEGDSFQDGAASMTDLICTSTRCRTTCTLNGASPSTCTATVASGATCTCANVGATAAIANNGCAVGLSGTTLTVTSANSATNVVNIHCTQ